MPLITRLEIEKFRCFEKLTVEGLSRVNLFVGANNSGKTALLEAVELLAADGAPPRLWHAMNRRLEYVFDPSLPVLHGEAGPGRLLDVTQLFHGRGDLENGRTFYVGTGQEPVDSFPRPPDQRFVRATVVEFQGGGFELHVKGPPTLRRGGTRLTLRRGISPSDMEQAVNTGTRDSESVAFVESGVSDPADLGRLFTEAARRGLEDLVDRAVRLVDPRVEGVTFADTSGRSGFGGILAKMKGTRDRPPLSSLGEGTKRAIGLAVAIARCQGGTLLVDEIENGVFHAVLPDLWKFLVEAANELDMQVFVTTHSKDCIEALATLHREQPQLAQAVTVHRLEAGRQTTVRLDARTIASATASEQEVR